MLVNLKYVTVYKKFITWHQIELIHMSQKTTCPASALPGCLYGNTPHCKIDLYWFGSAE